MNFLDRAHKETTNQKWNVSITMPSKFFI
jgi:hypothetical protein